jgi:hypothetical protein
MLQGIEKVRMNDCFERKETLETDGKLHPLGGEVRSGRPGYRKWGLSSFRVPESARAEI